LYVVSSAVLYAQINYRVVFDYTMIQNVFETDASEATSYLSTSTVVTLGILIASSVGWLWPVKIEYGSVLKELSQRFVASGATLVVAILLTLSCYAEFAATARNNPELKRQIIPFEWVDNTYDYWRDQLITEQQEFVVLDPAPTLDKTDHDKPRLTIMIVGETARADHFAYNGYGRDTNRYTAPFQPVYFRDVISCGTATAVSVPCMFSDLSRSDFSSNAAKNRQNLLDIAQDSGVDVTWIDNNSSCKGMCFRQRYERIDTDKSNPLCDGDYCFDEILVERLTAKLAQLSLQDSLIVLHQIGSHGPTYYRRYPDAHRLYAPDCPRSDIQNCSSQELINTYDNTIAYSDYINSKIIELADATHFDATVVYVSDHGESLGDGGVYLHGLPYRFAPEAQTRVPMWVWTNHHAQSLRNCLAPFTEPTLASHDNVFHTLLGMMGVSSSAHNPELDLTNNCSDLAAL
jgi:lipid A ethanolaminephosphotransferase